MIPFTIHGFVKAGSDTQGLEILRDELGDFQFTAGIVISKVDVGSVSEKVI